MKVLFVSAEVAPFAKAGGLGDVLGSLPAALRKQDIDARVLMPLYGVINRAKFHIEYKFHYQFPTRSGLTDVYIHKTTFDGVPIYFLEAWPYFRQGDALYTDWDWDMPRFIFFCQVILATAWEFRMGREDGEAWFPDVIHAHDWHTALTPYLLHEASHDPEWAQVASVLTLHNMAYQGPHGGNFMWNMGIPAPNHNDLIWQGKSDNLLGIGIAYADQINTVSPRHAIEIRYPRFGEGLEGMLQVRSNDVYGILNGMDVERNNPATDPHIQYHYTEKNFAENKLKNKLDLQRELGLPERPEVPLIGLVTRLTEQKGIDLALPALRRLFVEYDVQLAALGSGDKNMEGDLWWLCNDFSFKASCFIGFKSDLAQRIYAASDLFVMPSRYEPCGTSQMLAMRYGSLPVVRETGGLADTVENYDNGNAEHGTGFVFEWEEPDAVLGTLRWALDTYKFRIDAFRRMQQRGMMMDFSWDKSTKQYIAMYKRAISRH